MGQCDIHVCLKLPFGVAIFSMDKKNGTHFLRSNNTLSVLVFSCPAAELKIQFFSFRAKRQIFLFKQEQSFTIMHNCTLYLRQPRYDYSNTENKLICWQMGFGCKCMSDDCRYLG